MKKSQFKSLIKNIILEIEKNEMIVNKDEKPDVYGAVNVEGNGSFENKVRGKLKEKTLPDNVNEISLDLVNRARNKALSKSDMRSQVLARKFDLYSNKKLEKEPVFHAVIQKKGGSLFKTDFKILKRPFMFSFMNTRYVERDYDYVAKQHNLKKVDDKVFADGKPAIVKNNYITIKIFDLNAKKECVLTIQLSEYDSQGEFKIDYCYYSLSEIYGKGEYIIIKGFDRPTAIHLSNILNKELQCVIDNYTMFREYSGGYFTKLDKNKLKMIKFKPTDFPLIPNFMNFDNMPNLSGDSQKLSIPQSTIDKFIQLSGGSYGKLTESYVGQQLLFRIRNGEINVERVIADNKDDPDTTYTLITDDGNFRLEKEDLEYIQNELGDLPIQEKTLPDGKYVNDMEDHIKSNRIAGLKEMTSSGAAGGQEGGTIKVPAWGTKNKLGSPGAIKATKKMKGWKVSKSITDEGK